MRREAVLYVMFYIGVILFLHVMSSVELDWGMLELIEFAYSIGFITVPVYELTRNEGCEK